MLNRRFDWHEHLQEVEGEYWAARLAIDRLTQQLVALPELTARRDRRRAFIRAADRNLEGTYLVRLFAVFESALRSFDRARHRDTGRDLAASLLIDTVAGRRGQGISQKVRDDAHAVRRVRNAWAHANFEPSEDDTMTLAEARARLQTFLSWLPPEWK